ncbi:hypothetical protein SCP_1101070 [Sparassis crispa]|uniref:Uncharacterized protein n=1 Tax=Sparassis crispa TaxID=139825 RepID=A0A401GZ40_9APHY|nr:hypothetical protein SCP_1101070 [Sparassis crispa]GBE87431.1 hypothetical protein SCP_1101070 [Sparassis crispa]
MPPPQPPHLIIVDPITVPTPQLFNLLGGASTSSISTTTHDGISIAHSLHANPPPDYVPSWNFDKSPNHHAEGLTPEMAEEAMQTEMIEHSDQSIQTLVNPGEIKTPFSLTFSTALIGPQRTILLYVAYQ